MFSDTHRFQLLPQLCCAMIMRQRRRLLVGDFSSNLKLLQRYPPTDVLSLLSDARAIRAGFSTSQAVHSPSHVTAAAVARTDAAIRLAHAQAKLKQTGSRASSAAAAASVRVLATSKKWSKQAEAGWSALLANASTSARSSADDEEAAIVDGGSAAACPSSNAIDGSRVATDIIR
jgi:hypothetical protein